MLLYPSNFDIYPKLLPSADASTFCPYGFCGPDKNPNSKNRQNSKHQALNLARHFAFLYKRQKLADKF